MRLVLRWLISVFEYIALTIAVSVVLWQLLKSDKDDHEV
jgi:hypothetical protein